MKLTKALDASSVRVMTRLVAQSPAPSHRLPEGLRESEVFRSERRRRRPDHWCHRREDSDFNPARPAGVSTRSRRLPHGRSEESATTAGCVRRAQVLVEARELKTRDSYEADGTSQDSGAGTPEQMRTTVGTSSSLSGPLLTR